MEDIELFNEDVRRWGASFLGAAKLEGASQGITHRPDSPNTGSSLANMKLNYKQSQGMISSVSLSFRRSLIYPHKGAGKGMAGVKGSRWIDKYGNRKKTNPASFGKAGSGSRREKPFINKALEGSDGVEQLADIVAERLASTIVNRAIIQ